LSITGPIAGLKHVFFNLWGSPEFFHCRDLTPIVLRLWQDPVCVTPFWRSVPPLPLDGPPGWRDCYHPFVPPFQPLSTTFCLGASLAQTGLLFCESNSRTTFSPISPVSWVPPYWNSHVSPPSVYGHPPPLSQTPFYNTRFIFIPGFLIFSLFSSGPLAICVGFPNPDPWD